MTWQMVGNLPGGWEWTFTPPVAGDFFRLTYASNLPLSCQLCQGMRDGIKTDFFGIQPFTASSGRDVFFLPCPPPFADLRRIGFRQVDGYRISVLVEVWTGSSSFYVLTP